ncbi:MAG: phosphatase PAP2 family protein [Alphaproteobacteria bacterium]|jgi:lipid A 4'-phosphatase|nr:phosphatase PAP2 family protein [Alphaproteobacteria bacterium]
MFSLWINNYLVNISLIITAFLTFLLILFPEVDISFSQLFFSEESGFIYQENFLVYQLYALLPLLTKLFTLVCLLYLVYLIVKYRSYKRILRSGVFFLVIAAAISPGLVVNEVFKENFGRARPRHIEEFNGKREFTGAFTMSDQCKRNCSFSSGHAAMGYFLTAIAYTTNLLYFNRIYLIGIVFGSLVGLSRIVMGGHFLSDVLASAFVVLFLDHVIFILWQMLIKNLKK